MKFHLLVIFFIFSFSSSFSQSYTGQLINKESGQPIPFVNIGLLGRNIGTVSDTAGWFNLELDSEFDQDTVCLSCVGYMSRKYLVCEFKDTISSTGKVKFELSPIAYRLNEVIVRPVEFKTYTLGNFCDANSAYGNAFYSKLLGTEIGIVINLPQRKKKAFLKNFRFFVGEFTFDKFPVRLNIYDLKNDLPNENILEEPIYTIITSVGEYFIDLEKYNIITNGDFFISLEYYEIADNTEGKLIFCAVHNRKMNKSNGYYRLTSHGNWQRERFDNVGFSVQVDCEK